MNYNESFLQRLERMMREGQLPDPQTRDGLIVYSVIGFAIGWMLVSLGIF